MSEPNRWEGRIIPYFATNHTTKAKRGLKSSIGSLSLLTKEWRKKDPSAPCRGVIGLSEHWLYVVSHKEQQSKNRTDKKITVLSGSYREESIPQCGRIWSMKLWQQSRLLYMTERIGWQDKKSLIKLNIWLLQMQPSGNTNWRKSGIK